MQHQKKKQSPWNGLMCFFLWGLKFNAVLSSHYKLWCCSRTFISKLLCKPSLNVDSCVNQPCMFVGNISRSVSCRKNINLPSGGKKSLGFHFTADTEKEMRREKFEDWHYETFKHRRKVEKQWLRFTHQIRDRDESCCRTNWTVCERVQVFCWSTWWCYQSLVKHGETIVWMASHSRKYIFIHLFK